MHCDNLWQWQFINSTMLLLRFSRYSAILLLYRFSFYILHWLQSERKKQVKREKLCACVLMHPWNEFAMSLSKMKIYAKIDFMQFQNFTKWSTMLCCFCWWLSFLSFWVTHFQRGCIKYPQNKFACHEGEVPRIGDAHNLCWLGQFKSKAALAIWLPISFPTEKRTNPKCISFVLTALMLMILPLHVLHSKTKQNKTKCKYARCTYVNSTEIIISINII